jgi:hypothetical protein
MSAPLYAHDLFGEGASLLVAVLIGIGFGFFLERAGFGSARKLMGQFYLDDLAVFKVMFSAIVTAMLGLRALAWLGVLDLALVPLVPTYWVAQIAGGLLLGVGFVVGGYCPGTSLAAVATGRLDGAAYAAGFLVGTAGFAAGFGWLGGLYEAGSLGERTLPEALGVAPAVVVLGVVLVALGGFAGAGWIERRFAPRG